jgi:hypothetical protein
MKTALNHRATLRLIDLVSGERERALNERAKEVIAHVMPDTQKT